MTAEELDALCLRNFLGSGTGIYFFKNAQGAFVRVSGDCAALTGRTPDEMVGLTDADLTDAAHARELLDEESEVMATGRPLLDKEEVDRLVDRPGTWVETSKFPLRDHAGEVIGTFGHSRDVTRWRQAEADLVRANARLRDVQAQLKAILDSSTDGVAMYDTSLRYRYINPAGEAWRGRHMDELVGRTDREVGLPARTLELWEGALRRVLDTGVREELEVAGVVGLGGEGTWFHITLSPEGDADGHVVGVLASGRDMTALKEAQRELSHRANHDPLTGLANRALMDDRLASALRRLHRRDGVVVVFYIDLDGFKVINDRCGHAAGDDVLVGAARRLQSVARQQDTVARIGGDEFVVVCEMDNAGQVEQMAQRLTTAVASNGDIEDVGMWITGSVGVAVAMTPDVDPGTLIRTADQAMYVAKATGRNRWHVADTSTRDGA
jgi:diguanylate cyclase (GGDEF)-like protein/PAS domain S-box-containing protein